MTQFTVPTVRFKPDMPGLMSVILDDFLEVHNAPHPQSSADGFDLIVSNIGYAQGDNDYTQDPEAKIVREDGEGVRTHG